jgi:hypothetical protein
MPDPDEITQRAIADALDPDRLRTSVERIITDPPPTDGSMHVDVAAIATKDDAGAEVRVSTGGSWFSAQAWGHWMREKGWAAGGLGSFRWGGKK